MRDSPRKRKSHSFAHPFDRSIVRSFVHPFIHSFARGEGNVGSTYAGRCAAPARLRIDMHCLRLFPSCSPTFSNRRCPRYPTPSVFVAYSDFSLIGSMSFRTPWCAGGFISSPSYVLLSSSFARAQFVFYGHYRKQLYLWFLGLAPSRCPGSIPGCAAPALGYWWIFIRRRNLLAEEVNRIARNSGVRDYDDIYFMS